MSGTPTSGGRRDNPTQSSIVEYGERLNGTNLNPVNSTEMTVKWSIKSCMNVEKTSQLTKEWRG